MSIPGFVRQHVRENGTPKVGYATEARAEREAGLEKSPRYWYRCSLCGQWHLTHIPVMPGRKPPMVPWFGQ